MGQDDNRPAADFLKEMGGRVVYPVVDTVTTMDEEPKKPGLDRSLALPERGDLIPTRESLLSRLKDWRDGDSWQEFFETYWRLIYGVVRKAGLTDAEAQDIVQETMLSVARKIEGFRYDPKVCSFKTWMLKLTRWRILNQLIRRTRETSQTQVLIGDAAEGTDTSEQIADPAGCDFRSGTRNGRGTCSPPRWNG